MIGGVFYDAQVKADGKDITGLMGQTELHEDFSSRGSVSNGHKVEVPTGNYKVKLNHDFLTSSDTKLGNLGSIPIEIVDDDYEYTFLADSATLSKTGKQEGFQWYSLTAQGTGKVRVVRRD